MEINKINLDGVEYGLGGSASAENVVTVLPYHSITQNGVKTIEDGGMTSFNSSDDGIYLAEVAGYENGATLIAIDHTKHMSVFSEHKYAITYFSSPASTSTAYVTVAPLETGNNEYENAGVIKVTAEGANVTLKRILKFN